MSPRDKYDQWGILVKSVICQFWRPIILSYVRNTFVIFLILISSHINGKMERSLSLSLAHSSLDTLWSSPVCCQEYLPSSKEFCEQMDFKVMTKENSAITIVHEKKQLTSLQKHSQPPNQN